MKKVVIIGGVAGGASCAARLRRLDEEAEIVLLERGRYISYANCGLPYHVGDVIKSRDALLVSTPQMMKQRFNIDVRTGSEAISIDRAAKKVSVKGPEGVIYDEPYDQLVISTGSSPIKPPIPGIDSDRIMTLWTVPDTDKIRKMALKSGYSSAAVIGGGFIGLEIAENLKHAGLEVSIVEGSDQVMPPADREMAELIHEHIESSGVDLYLSEPVSSFEEIGEGESRKIKVITKTGRDLAVDFVVLSIGIRPNNELTKDCGLELGERGGIAVNDRMMTSDENIYAVGDVSETFDFTTGERASYQLAGPANKQGRIAANNICGGSDTYKGTQAASIAKVFDISVGMTGKSEKALVRQGLVKGKDFDTAYITQNQHAGYYPGAVPMTIKIIFSPDGSKIFGAQIIGLDGVDKRVDTISVAARAGLKATDLADLELAYAPPYSSAKDPVNMAGFVIRNIIDGMVKFSDLDEPEKSDVQIVDVREDAERLAFEIPGAIGIPLGDLRSRIGELDKNKKTVVFCAIGVRSYNGARILMQNGFGDVSVYPGGSRFYQSTHYKKFGASFNEASPDADTGASSISGNAGNENGVASGSEDTASPSAGEVKRVRLDCSGMQCPGPIMSVFDAMKTLEDGDELEISASDPGFTKDVAAWCRRTGNTLLSNEKVGSDYIAKLRKGTAACSIPFPRAEEDTQPIECHSEIPDDHDGKTIIVFSGDMDKVLASFIIANGAAAMGKPVTMFFTFWGLSVLRKEQKQRVDKTAMEKMFGAMLPRGSGRLKLSKMNMGGMGTKMMKKIMKDKNVDSLEELIRKAMANGVKIVACTMSMDVMGIKPEELIPGVELGGVGYYLGDAEESNVNLFI